MDVSTYPDPNVLLARLMQIHEDTPPQHAETSAGEFPAVSTGRDFLSQLAQRVGMQSQDVHLVAGVPLSDATRFDEEASGELPGLVRHALSLSSTDRQQLRDFARSLPELPRTAPMKERKPYEQYPPGFGSLLVGMLELRNLGWSSAAKVMYLMSGVYLSPATIGAIGRGTRELDADLLDGFSAVLGIPVETLEVLTGVGGTETSNRHSVQVTETASLLWDVRNLTAAQVRDVSDVVKAPEKGNLG